MLNLTLRIVIIVLCLLFLFFVFRSISRHKMLLKYSFTWIALSVLAMICAIFPQIVYFFADILGFEEPSNFLFFVVIFFLLAICVSLSIAVSDLAGRVKRLIQAQALLEKKLDSENKE